MLYEVTRGCWRLLCGLRGLDARHLLKSPRLVRDFFLDWRTFRKLGGNAPFSEITPKIFDRSLNTQTGGGHYFYQDVWALRKLRDFQPAEHHDVGSRLDGFVAQATAICPVTYWDIRAPQFQLPDFQFRHGSILNLPLANASVQSISSLNVVEHIGLGRYGDEIAPSATEIALRELQRVVAPGGQLLLAMPVGRERVEFNAHRVWNPDRPIQILGEMRLSEFKAIDDAGGFREAVRPLDFYDSKFACGLYCFVKN
jgi:SAM-dependent methyltransferase